MKRIFALLMLLSLILTSCQVKEPLRSYIEAVERTEAVDEGQSLFSIEVKNTYRDDEDLDVGDDLQFEMYSQYDFTDSEHEKLEAHSYLYTGDIGMDFSFYSEDDTIFIKLPFEENYLVIDYNTINQEATTFQGEDVFTILFQPFMEKWLSILQEENVVRGEKTIMTTEDGDVKATKYTIQLNEEQLEALIIELFSILKSNSDLLVSTANSYMDCVLSEDELIQLIDDFQSELLKSEMSMTVVSYINADGFIIDTEVEYTVKYDDEDMPIESQVYLIRMEEWDIYKDQNFNIPELTEDNSLTMDEFENEMNVLFKNK